MRELGKEQAREWSVDEGREKGKMEEGEVKWLVRRKKGEIRREREKREGERRESD